MHNWRTFKEKFITIRSRLSDVTFEQAIEFCKTLYHKYYPDFSHPTRSYNSLQIKQIPVTCFINGVHDCIGLFMLTYDKSQTTNIIITNEIISSSDHKHIDTSGQKNREYFR